jgi:AraC family transcriptional regulator
MILVKNTAAAVIRRRAMREENASRMMSPTENVVAEDAHGSILPLHVNPSPRSITSASARVGHLVERAMTFLETDREAAWRCLRDASTLLGAEREESMPDAPNQITCRAGGLAIWQATRVLTFVEDNLESKMATEEMANVAALSKSHFARAFKRSLGYSPMTYVVVRRVERAKLMMMSTRERLTDIALACGFADQSHLNRSFRRVVGTSPGRWRRMSQYTAH